LGIRTLGVHAIVSSCDLLGGINPSWSCRLAKQRSGSPLVIHGSEVHAKFSDGRVSFFGTEFPQHGQLRQRQVLRTRSWSGIRTGATGWDSRSLSHVSQIAEET
jgi:hypothetical protein